jgi:2-keto-3-deoxy-6-phosphogluconate aldolase
VIVGPELLDEALARGACIVAADPYVYYARLTQLWKRAAGSLPAAGVHASAVVDPLAVVHPQASIGPLCVVERGARIGAGTVLTPQDVDAVADAGARLVLAPNFDAAVVRRAKARGLWAMPGVATPSESEALAEEGIEVVSFPMPVSGKEPLQ